MADKNKTNNTESLDEWYNDIMSKTVTENEKNRIQKEYDKRKANGKGKPLTWIPSAEESSAKMQQSSPEFDRNIKEKTSQARRSASTTSKVAEGLARQGALVSALNGDIKSANSLNKTANKIEDASDKLIKEKVKDEKTVESIESKPIDYDNLNESYNNPNSTFEDLKKYYQDEKGMSDDEFAKLIENSDWSKGKKAGEWLNNYDAKNGNIRPVSYNGIDTKTETETEKKSLTDLKKDTVDSQYRDAIDDSKLIEDISETQKKDVSDYEDMNKIADKFYEKSSNIDDFYKENLPKTIWNMYKDGEFDGNTGDPQKDKKIAKERLGYFILNGLGTGLINSSLIARGSAPSVESDLAKIRREKLEGGLERYNKKRDETMSKTLEQLGLNAELLNKYNIDLDTLKNNKIFDEVSKSLDRKGIERTMKAYKSAGQYLDGLTDKQKSDVFMAIMALNSKDGASAGVSYLVSVFGKPIADTIMSIFGE